MDAEIPALTLEEVTKRYQDLIAVDQLSIKVRQGWMYGLLGPNGAGKTTTIRMILNIIRPDEGRILLGNSQDQVPSQRIGYLPEERGLYRKMKVIDLLMFLAAIKGMARDEARREATRWLDRFGLSKRSFKKVEELSKGLQQQVQFIACIIHRPELLILDEPFTGLDPVNVNLMKDLILELNDAGTTIILSTHHMEQVERLCQHICLINKGSKVLDGRLSDIKSQYGRNTIRLEFVGPKGFLTDHPLVEHMDLYGQYVELRPKPSADPQELLRAAMESVRILRYEIVEPSLNDIFIEKVKERDE
jgi:ABC-2 type transport system ATP-binding protein